MNEKKKVERRDFVKGLAALPVLGAFAGAMIGKHAHDADAQKRIFRELGIDLDALEPRAENPGKKGDLIRLGIIGIGSRGSSILESLGFMKPDSPLRKAQDPGLNVAVTGVCDVHEKHAERALAMAGRDRYGDGKPEVKVKRYSHYRDLLASDEIDAVIIASPDHWHAPMIIDAASSGKPVYCEKCLTRTIEESYEVRDALLKSGILFQYGHQNRQQDSYRIARAILEKNVLGKITLIKTHTNRNNERGAWIRHKDETIDPQDVNWKEWLGSAPHTPFTPSRYYGWQKFFEYSGGLPPHMFSHEYDAINQVLDLGIPESVTALGGIYYWKDDRNTPDVMQALFEYPDRGLVLTYDATLASSSTGEYQSGAKVKEILGSDAWMKLSMNINIVPDRHSKRFGEKIENGLMDPGAPFISYSPGRGVDAVTSASEKYYASQGLVYTYIGGKKVDVTMLHVREWLNAIRFGTEVSCGIGPAFEDAITCLMATRSYQEKRRVFWDPARKRVT